ncbi:hypothetical protein AVEN_18844-1 [Araneus ventricosus]|uniref:Uncharacterized protein n=1 Tax=Araneus ventricosus TaxID=182803 RepID=A0A4Y2IJD8_ARAVE|nr:hypothetical protein AVEN_18844-1 [Araneus ventricosus]
MKNSAKMTYSVRHSIEPIRVKLSSKWQCNRSDRDHNVMKVELFECCCHKQAFFTLNTRSIIVLWHLKNFCVYQPEGKKDTEEVNKVQN